MRTRPLRLVEPDAVAPVSPLADEHDVLTQREAAALLRMSVSSVIRHGDSIPHRRVGCVPRYSRQQLLAWIKGAK